MYLLPKVKITVAWFALPSVNAAEVLLLFFLCLHAGRYVVNLPTMARMPVYWGFEGTGDLVRRGVWMHDTKQGFVPYSPG